MTRTCTWIAVVVALSSQIAMAQKPSPSLEARRIAAYVETLGRQAVDERGVPAMSIAVARGDDLLCASGFGWSDARRASAATEDTSYAIGSLTRQFTAVAVLQLAEAEKLALDDEIQKHLPLFPAGTRKITLRQLLSNTSGVPGYAAIVAKHPEAADEPMSEARFFGLFEDVPFAFEPGSSFSLDSAGYVLLSMVVAKASRVSFGAYVTHEILEPAGLADTRFCPLQDPPLSYARECKQITSTSELEVPLAAAPASATQSLCSTAVDLVTWSRLLLGRAAFGEDLTRQMTTAGKLADGASTGYGFALSIARLGDDDVWSHTGGVGGFRVRVAHYRPSGITIAVLANCDSAPVEEVERSIASVLLGLEALPVLDLPVDAEEAKRCAGGYQLATTHVEISARDGRLWFESSGEPATRMRSQGGGEFALEREPDVRLRFKLDGERAESFELVRNGTISVARRIE